MAIGFGLGDSVASLGDLVASLGDSVASFGDSVPGLGDFEAELGDSAPCLSRHGLHEGRVGRAAIGLGLGDSVASLGDSVVGLGDSVAGFGDSGAVLGESADGLNLVPTCLRAIASMNGAFCRWRSASMFFNFVREGPNTHRIYWVRRQVELESETCIVSTSSHLSLER